MANFTPFRQIDKLAQRNFKTDFYGLDGIWFNKIYGRYVEPAKKVPSEGWELNELKRRIVYGFRCRTRMPNADYEKNANRIVELLTQALAAMTKVAKKNALIAEAKGQHDLETIKSMFFKVDYIAPCCKKFHKLHLVTACSDAGRQYDSSWEKLEGKPFYTCEEVQAVIDKVVENKINWMTNRIKLVKDIQERAHQIGI